MTVYGSPLFPHFSACSYGPHSLLLFIYPPEHTSNCLLYVSCLWLAPVTVWLNVPHPLFLYSSPSKGPTMWLNSGAALWWCFPVFPTLPCIFLCFPMFSDVSPFVSLLSFHLEFPGFPGFPSVKICLLVHVDNSSVFPLFVQSFPSLLLMAQALSHSCIYTGL